MPTDQAQPVAAAREVALAPLIQEIETAFDRLSLRRERRAALARARARLVDIAPRDAIEGMLAVQLTVAHEALLFASRRALDATHSDELRQAERRQADKLQKLALQIAAALDRRRRDAAHLATTSAQPKVDPSFKASSPPDAAKDPPPEDMGSAPGDGWDGDGGRDAKLEEPEYEHEWRPGWPLPPGDPRVRELLERQMGRRR